MRRAQGYVLYQGPSRLNGEPIVAIATMRTAVSQVLEKPLVRAAARETVLPYSPEAMASQYVALYRRLLGIADT